MITLPDNQLIDICIRTFAKHHQIEPNSISVLNYKDRSINLEPPPSEGHVSAGILSKCIWIETQSSVGSFSIYMRKTGAGNVYWKSN